MKIFPLAYRNIWRRKTRAFTTIGAMAFAAAIMIFYWGLMDGLLDVLERNLIMMNLGDVQIHKEGYRSDPDLYTKIENHQAILGKLESSGFLASPRLFGFGLAAHDQNSAGVSIMGVDIEREKKVTQTYKHLASGSWLDEEDPDGVVIGIKLAKTLDVTPGEKLVLVSQSTDGSMANNIYRVRGVLKGVGDAVDRGSLFMTQAALREFLAVPEGVHEIVILRKDRTEPLEDALAKARAAAGGYETKSWKELSPVMASVLEVSDASSIVMVLIMYAAVAMVTLNAMLMSVFERIREFGIMKALGASPSQILALVLIEAAIQALIASILALMAGIPVSLYYEKHGIDLSELGEGVTLGGVTMEPIWYTHVTLDSISTPVITLFMMVFMAALYPGLKAAMIRPVSAIHHL